MNYKKLFEHLNKKKNEDQLSISSKTRVLRNIQAFEGSDKKDFRTRSGFLLSFKTLGISTSTLSGIAAALIVSIMIWKSSDPKSLYHLNDSPSFADSTFTKHGDSIYWQKDTID
jgi:hypothetical protein